MLTSRRTNLALGDNVQRRERVAIVLSGPAVTAWKN